MLTISFVCIYFLAFIIPKHANCSPLEPSGPGLAIHRKLSESKTYHESNQNNGPLNPPASPPSSPISPRVVITVPMGDHWQIAVESIQALHPGNAVVGLAVDILTEFYTAIEAHALTFENQYTVSPWMSFVAGDLRLSFYSALGHIPWPFIGSFAALLRTYTANGWTGLYEARAMHLSGVVVAIALRLEQQQVEGAGG